MRYLVSLLLSSNLHQQFAFLCSPHFLFATQYERRTRQRSDTSETMSAPAGEHQVLFPEQPHPSLRTGRELWSAGERVIPSFDCSPWDFYEKFIELHTGGSLVLCDNRSTVRVIRVFRRVESGRTPVDTHAEGTVCSSPADSVRSVSSSPELPSFCLLPIRHQNFVGICEAYLFNHQIFAITEYVGFSLETLLQRGIRPLEPEIAYIISQAS